MNSKMSGSLAAGISLGSHSSCYSQVKRRSGGQGTYSLLITSISVHLLDVGHSIEGMYHLGTG